MQKQTNSGELAPQTRDLTSLDQLQALEAKNHKFSDDFDQRKAAQLSVNTRMKEMRKYSEDGVVQPENFIDSFDHLTQDQKDNLKKEYESLRTKTTEEKLKYFLLQYGLALVEPAIGEAKRADEVPLLAIATVMQYAALLGLPATLIWANIKQPEIFIPAEVATLVAVDSALKYRKNTTQNKLNKQIAKALIDNPISPTPEIKD